MTAQLTSEGESNFAYKLHMRVECLRLFCKAWNIWKKQMQSDVQLRLWTRN